MCLLGKDIVRGERGKVAHFLIEVDKQGIIPVDDVLRHLFRDVAIIVVRCLVAAFYHVHPRLAVADKPHFKSLACGVARTAYAIVALIFGISLHQFPRQFMRKLKPLHQPVALKIIERALLARAHNLGKTRESLAVAVKTLFPAWVAGFSRSSMAH